MNSNFVMEIVKPYVKYSTFLPYSDFYRIFSGMKFSKEEFDAAQSIIENERIELIYSDIFDDQTDDEAEEIDDDELFMDSKYSSKTYKREKEIKQTNETLCSLIQRGNKQAKNDLCIENRTMVLKYAAKCNKYYGNGLSIEDLEQAGYLGLLRAAEMFDSSIGTRFSTYAVYWIKQAISREIFDNGFTIRMPVHIMEKISKVVKLDIEYDMKGFPFNDRTVLIAEDLDMPVFKVIELLSLNNRLRICSSLNAPVGEDKETELESFIAEVEAPSLEDIVA